ncbi:Rv0909 family putative TA system antitoxin [Leucobacter sp. wl10]|uniref:Rv0909 family putative TA system antitoxin n=1 Tax=Leucobacter sp. wl10 TaxID=2304677 RepID=UPI000E5A2895|nr:Rv0909 family putative TA system antitoxin [Leucobacter sp. wl10]RGE19668.1 antitoxin [Leucobacter sp. wl10]
MAIEDLSKKASDLAGKAGGFAKQNADKIEEALKSEKAEGISDKILDGAAGLANKVTGGKHADRISEARDNLDGKIGNE